MHNRLRVNQHLNLVSFYAEEPFGFDHLETLVHHRSRVDGDLCTHIPCRVAQGVSLGHMGNLLHRLQTERTARGRQQDLLDGVLILTDETLEDGRVLTIDRQDGGVVLLGQLQDQFTGNHQCLLVGETNRLTCLDGMDGGVQTGETDHGSKHHVDRTCLHNLVECLGTGIHFDVGQVAHQRLQLIVTLFVGNHDGGGLELVGLLCQQLNLIIGCQTIDFI